MSRKPEANKKSFPMRKRASSSVKRDCPGIGDVIYMRMSDDFNFEQVEATEDFYDGEE